MHEISFSELFLQTLSNLQQAISADDLDSFKNMSNVIGCICNEENKLALCTYNSNTKNSIESTNLVILACKHNSIKILKYIFDNSKILDNLSVNIGLDAIAVDDKDELCHNAFYYAIRSNNVELLALLINKWPGNYFAIHVAKLDEIISRAYEELRLKNILLSDEMKFFVENTLINLRFFPHNSDQVRNVKVSLNSVKKRIELVLENINILNTEYSNVEEVDERFLFIAKFVAQNIHVLKRQLKITYDMLPWEEMEFCLIAFINSKISFVELNLIYTAILTKDKILLHLKNFAIKLVKTKIHEMHVNSNLPNSKREKVITTIVSKHPTFEELYNDYEQVKNVYSLEKIANYIEFALTTNPEKKEGRLIIARALQVTGEYLKNSLESPSISDSIKEILLSSGLQRSTEEVIKSFRNALSHFYSLKRRIEIEENEDTSYFSNVQNDLKKIKAEIVVLREKSKAKAIKMCLKQIINGDDLNAVKKLVDMLFNILPDLKEIRHENAIDTEEFIKLKSLIDELNENIDDKTPHEINLFNQIRKIINCEEDKSSAAQGNYAHQIFNIADIGDYVNTTNSCSKALKTKFKNINIEPKIQFKIFKDIPQLVYQIHNSTKLRKFHKFHKINYLINQISYSISLELGGIKSIEILRSLITENEEKLFPNVTREQEAKDCLSKRIDTLRSILSINELLNDSNLLEKFIYFKKNKELQLVVEMLVLDIMEVLQHLEYLGNNLLFLDKYSPLLIGRCLRNHLAHGNVLINVLQFDTSLVIFSNSIKLVKEEKYLGLKIIGQVILDNLSSLKDRFVSNLNLITNQQQMFEAARKGDLDKIKNCISKGADVKARDINQWTLLHFSAAGGSLETINFFLDYDLDINAKDIKDQKPLHIAVSYGKKDVVDFFIRKKGLCVNDLGYDGKTPLHISAANGHQHVVEFLLKYKSDVEIKDKSNLIPLHYAAKNGHQDIVTLLLLNKGITVNSKGGGNWTPLHFAAQNGHTEVVKIILERKGDANVKTHLGDTPLSCASQEGHVGVVKVLLAHGVDINNQSVDGLTPLISAICYGNFEVVRTLLATNKANINALGNKRWIPLHEAARQGHLNIINVLLMNKSKVNALGHNNVTALQLAAEYGHLDVVQLLLDKKANINRANKNGYTPLHFAAEGGYEKIVKSLLEKGAEVNKPDNKKWTPLHHAAYDGRLDVVNTLLVNGANAMVKTNQNNTPLHLAAGNGYSEIVKVLLKKTDINCTSYNGTPLQCAAGRGHLETVKVLLINRANVNTRDSDSWTPLRIAVQNNNLETVKVLLASGADVNAVDNENATPLLLAVQEGYVRIVEALLVEGANVNVLGKGNNTPLHFAAARGHEYIVETLLNNGAFINAKTKQNTTPLYFAVKGGHAKVVSVLLKQGAEINFDNEISLLHLAVANGNKEIVQILLEKNKTSINSKNEDGWTSLHVAAGLDKCECIKILLKNKANVDARDSKNYTPLYLAVQQGHVKAVEALLAGGASVNNLENILGVDNVFCTMTLLHLAIKKGYRAIVEALLENGASMDIKADNDCTPLCLAVHGGHQDIVNDLLKRGVNVNTADNCGITPLELAAAKGYEEIVKVLLNHGAKIDSRRKDGSTALHQAAFYGHENIIDILLNEGAKIDDIDEGIWTPLHCAVQQGQEKAAKVLLLKGANVNFTDKYGRTPLHWSVQNGYEKIIEILLQNKANVNAIDDQHNMMPLHFASINGHLKAVIALLSVENININSLDLSYRAPIHYATFYNHKEIVQVLLSKGAYFDIKEYDNLTPLQIALKKGYLEIIALLKLVQKLFMAVKDNNYLEVKSCIKKKVLVNSRSIEHEGATPLLYALSKGYTNIFNFLLKNNANVNILNNENSTLLHIAVKSGFLEITKTLLKHGVTYNMENKEGKMPVDLSKNPNIINLLNLVKELFEDAKIGDVRVIDKLTALKPGEFLCVTNTRNNQGYTLMQVAIANKHKNIASELLEILKKKPGQNL